ncbi:MAG: hypothetical protein HEQ20_11820 [Aphanizomenon flos-aquae KM1D3_PB]|uniref:hypothetical protein n=1 Tax=Aphanizomenon flos-aquae TaxID=1176 RepID=UPI00057CBE7A|nr:hypothetical protein [Aphanizomenon flos-aquae]QSV71327.1 MAG: hypothetical protein HEQ20_11820 [Aphanizomenon flos-aquae KM1D3_PB]
MSVENYRYGKAKGKRQEARVKRVWAILHFFTQFGFIVFTYLHKLFVRKLIQVFGELQKWLG